MVVMPLAEDLVEQAVEAGDRGHVLHQGGGSNFDVTALPLTG